MTRERLFFNVRRLLSLKPKAGMLCLICALAVSGGCGKKSIPPPAVPSSASDSSSEAAAPASPPPANRVQSSPPSASPTATGPTQLQSLNRALLGWKIKNRRQPQSFEDFASSAGFQIPSPPPGKRYALSSGFIVLVNSN